MRLIRCGWAASLLRCLMVGLLLSSAQSAELKENTAAAFDRYISATEAEHADDLLNRHFLVIDRLPDAPRLERYGKLRQGQIYIEPIHTKQDSRSIQIPGGLVHHWVGVIFVPGATLSHVLTVLQDYDNHKKVYEPDVRESRLIEHQGNEFKVYLQLYRKSLVTVVFNLNVNVQYTLLSSTRAMSKSNSTRIAEVENAGKSDEHELPVGNDHGYLWRLNNYWRIEERDGGVYVQVESVGLSRTIPWTVAWLVNPLVHSIPRNTLSRLLNATRTAVVNANLRTASLRRHN